MSIPPAYDWSKHFFPEEGTTGRRNVDGGGPTSASRPKVTNLTNHPGGPREERWPDPPAHVAFHGVAGDIVRAVQKHTEADPVALLGTLLATVGACMGRFKRIHQGSWQAPNLFVALVGDTATGRKGTAAAVIREVMNAAYPEWEDHIVPGLGSGEGLISYLSSIQDEDARDALVMETELGRLLTSMARDGSTLSPVLRDAWDGVPMGRTLARTQTRVNRHHVALLGHITPIELKSRLTNEDAANGFGNRFIWLAVRRSQVIAFPGAPAPHVAPFVPTLHKAIVDARNPGEMTWSGEAVTMWQDLYRRLTTRRRFGLLGALYARAEAHIVRLALIYALLDLSCSIEAAHLAAAAALWDYSERSGHSVFGFSTGDRRADSLLRTLEDGPMGWEEARRAEGISQASTFRDIVDLLESLSLIAVTTVPREGGGRPRRILSLVNGGEP